MQTPEELHYSPDHEWIRVEGDNRIRLGITDFAQDALGDVVYVDLPQVGRSVAKGESISEVESTKSVSDIYAPLAGQVVEVNDELADAPDKLNSDPYGEGWICIIELESTNDLSSLLTASAYIELTEA